MIVIALDPGVYEVSDVEAYGRAFGVDLSQILVIRRTARTQGSLAWPPIVVFGADDKLKDQTKKENQDAVL